MAILDLGISWLSKWVICYTFAKVCCNVLLAIYRYGPNYSASKCMYTLPPFPDQYDPWTQNRFLCNKRKAALENLEEEVNEELRQMMKEIYRCLLNIYEYNF